MKRLTLDSLFNRAQRVFRGLVQHLRRPAPPMELGDILPLLQLFRTAIYAKDPITGKHSDRVAAYLTWFADLVHGGLDETKRWQYPIAGMLHDVGKTQIPTLILTSSQSLSLDEQRLLQKHPAFGEALIRHVPAFQSARSIVLHHHERYDGTGYPAQLKGSGIPLDARMAALVDTFDAITGGRTYRPAQNLDAALQEIIANSGSQFDPYLVELFVQHFHGIRALYGQLHQYKRKENLLASKAAT